MKRREFFGLLGGAVAAPFVASAQQPVPLVGVMDITRVARDEILRGLSESGLAPRLPHLTNLR